MFKSRAEKIVKLLELGKDGDSETLEKNADKNEMMMSENRQEIEGIHESNGNMNYYCTDADDNRLNEIVMGELCQEIRDMEGVEPVILLEKDPILVDSAIVAEDILSANMEEVESDIPHESLHEKDPVLVNISDIVAEDVLSANMGGVEPDIFHDSLHEKDPTLEDNQAIFAENMNDANFTDLDSTNNTSLLSEGTSTDIENQNCIKGRKRFRSESTWQRNVIKAKRNRGEEYINWKGKTVSKRSMKDPCSTCRNKCTSKFSEEERLQIFNSFWALGDINRQRDFLIHNTRQKPTQRSRIRGQCMTKKHDAMQDITNLSDEEGSLENECSSSQRVCANFYFFELHGKSEKVCQTFFLNTLSISVQMVKTAFSKKSKTINAVEDDRRGKVQCNSRLANCVMQSVKEHINKFPKVESHYCRQKSSREYLSADLNIVKMYELYKEYCKENNISSVAKLSMYRYIFNKYFNLSFHKPKKDTCDLCENYKNCSDEEKTCLQDTIDCHLRNKTLSREKKELAKKRCIEDKSFCAGVFDLQQVLLCPQLQVSQVYYRRKLSTYNLTMYDLHEKTGHCYMWNESNGNRGSNEIGSCVKLFIETKIKEGKKEFCFFSDNCGGQNLNRNMFTMYLQLAIKYKIKISHCFLVKGHTQNEGDSIHSAIERASRNVPIYVPSQWYLMARTSCRKNPYKVTEMGDFFDFAKLRSECCNNMNVDEDGKAVKWQKVRMVMVEHSSPSFIYVKYDYNEESFAKVNIEPRRRKNTKTIQNTEANILYKDAVPIATKKFKDLEHLCKMNIIPHEYHSFFLNLKHSASSNEVHD